MRLTEREKALSTKTLVAPLCVPALLRTRAIHLTLVYIFLQKKKKKMFVEGRRMILCLCFNVSGVCFTFTSVSFCRSGLVAGPA